MTKNAEYTEIVRNISKMAQIADEQGNHALSDALNQIVCASISGEKLEKNINILLVDGNSLFKRSILGAKNVFNRDGIHIGGIYQFITVLRKLIDENLYHHVFVFWDGELSGQLRYNLYKDYKSNRKYTLPIPRVAQVPVDTKCSTTGNPLEPLMSGTTGQTVFHRTQSVGRLVQDH